MRRTSSGRPGDQYFPAGINVNVFNMITRIHEATILRKYFHTITNGNLIVQHVIKNKNGIIKHVNVSVNPTCTEGYNWNLSTLCVMKL